MVVMSCGSTTNGDYDYVTATASVDSTKNPLLADLATWTGTPCTTGSTYTITNDVVNVTVASTVKQTNVGTSPLVLQKATISYSPADTMSPALSPPYSPISQSLNGYTVPAGGTLSVPIEVAPHSLKDYFGSALVCTANSPVYSYNVTIIFDAVEQLSGTSGSFSSGMIVRFADFADK